MVRKHLIIAAGMALALSIILTTTHPERLPAALFIVVFALLYGLMVYALIGAGLVAVNLGLLPWQLPRIRRTAMWASVLPVFLLILQSIGQLTLQDIIITLGLFALLYLYFSRMPWRSAG